MRSPLSNVTVTGAFLERAVPGTGLKDTAGVARHIGVDLRASVGTTLYAPANGTVLNSYTNPNSGLQVIEASIEGKTHRFLHLSRRDVYAGNKFSQGQVIGLTGNSGGVAAHLHWDVRKAGTTYNNSLYNYHSPLSLLNENSTGGQIMDTDAKVQAQYYTLRGDVGTAGERKDWIGKSYEQFNSVAKPEVDGRTRNITNLTNAVMALTSERDTARRQVATLTSELLAEKDRVKVLESNLSVTKAELDGAKQAYSELMVQHEAQISDLNKVIGIKDKEIKRLTDELANCDGESLTWSQHLILGIRGLLSALNPINKEK